MSTAIVHHPIYAKHDTGPGHPETALRYEAVMSALREDARLWGTLKEITPEQASKGTVQAAHTPQHFKEVENAFANIRKLRADVVAGFQCRVAEIFA